MFGLGIGELLLIALVLFLLFGASKLPQLGQGLGESVKSFRKAFREVNGDDPSRKPPPPPSPPAS
jgi:sec-independent protein translocase protein TatA